MFCVLELIVKVAVVNVTRIAEKLAEKVSNEAPNESTVTNTVSTIQNQHQAVRTLAKKKQGASPAYAHQDYTKTDDWSWPWACATASSQWPRHTTARRPFDVLIVYPEVFSSSSLYLMGLVSTVSVVSAISILVGEFPVFDGDIREDRWQ